MNSRLLSIAAALMGLAPVAVQAEAPAAPAAAVAAPLTLTPQTIALLKGRWEGEWRFADGTSGRMKLQIEQADPTLVKGELRYEEYPYADHEHPTIAWRPRLDGERMLLEDAAGRTLPLSLERSGNGYVVSWEDRADPPGQTIAHRLTKGAVEARPAAEVGPDHVRAVTEIRPDSALPRDWHRSGPFMEIYVRGYQDSNGDGLGDLKGLTSRLDYLRDLGIRGLWLMPITASQDHDHGYAVAHYRSLEAAYGSLDDLKTLLDEAHKRGIGVIMDYVMNHSASRHPVFQQSRTGAENRYRDWYVWSESKQEGWDIHGRKPWHKTPNGFYFGSFGGNMPDWNLRNPEVVEFHLDNIRFWMNLGVDGLRFDAVDNLIENGPEAWEAQADNLPLMAKVRALLDRYRNRYMVCEAPVNPQGTVKACGSAFAFDTNKNIIAAAKGDAEAIGRVAEYPLTASPNMATLLSNHDSFAGQRLFDQVNGDPKQYRLAAATYLTQPGIPFIYYGEELGMAGGQGLGGDWSLRTPVSWTADARTGGFSSAKPFRALPSNIAEYNAAAQAGRPDSIHGFYKTLIAARARHPAFGTGSYEQAKVTGKTLSFRRVAGRDRVLVVLNYGTEAQPLQLDRLPKRARLKPVFGAEAGLRTGADGRVRFTQPPQSASIYAY